MGKLSASVLTRGVGSGLAQVLPVQKFPEYKPPQVVETEKEDFFYTPTLKVSPDGIFSQQLANSVNAFYALDDLGVPFYQAKGQNEFLPGAQDFFNFSDNARLQFEEDIDVSKFIESELLKLKKSIDKDTQNNISNTANDDLYTSILNTTKALGNVINTGNVLDSFNQNSEMLYAVDFSKLIEGIELSDAEIESLQETYGFSNETPIVPVTLNDIPLVGYGDNSFTIGNFDSSFVAANADWRTLIGSRVPFMKTTLEIGEGVDMQDDGLGIFTERRKFIPYDKGHMKAINDLFKSVPGALLNNINKFKTGANMTSVRLTPAGESFAREIGLESLLKVDEENPMTIEKANQVIDEYFKKMVDISGKEYGLTTKQKEGWVYNQGTWKSDLYSWYGLVISPERAKNEIFNFLQNPNLALQN